MKKTHAASLFVLCILLVFLLDVKDFTSVADLLSMHPVDYAFSVFWAVVFYLLLLPVAVLSQKFLFVVEEINHKK